MIIDNKILNHFKAWIIILTISYTISLFVVNIQICVLESMTFADFIFFSSEFWY